MRTAVFSIISPNYRHFARVLMDSARQHHPEWDRFVLVVGEPPAADRGPEPFTTVALEALALPNPRQFCFRYTLLELNTGVKPWMFAHLFRQGYDRVIYLDPDIVLYTPLVELDALPSQTFLALTPHLTGSIGAGEDHPSERTIMQAGAYNLGFLSVSRRPPLESFLAWWQEKLEFQCVVEVERGLFVDQKWMDLVPGLFPDVAILRQEGYNVAYWNLRQRHVAEVDGTLTSNGQPLRFFHFSGADPAFPEMVSKHDGRLRLADVGAAGRLIDDYSAALRSAGYDSFKNAAYAFGTFTDGTRLPDAARIAYRHSAELQIAAGDDPFDHPELFAGLRDAYRPPLAARMAVVSYQTLSRARPLVRLVPKSMRTALREFLLGRREAAAPSFRGSPTLSPGLNVVGYVGRNTGVGESARLCLRSCQAADVPSHAIDIDDPDKSGLQPRHRATIYHVNADQTLIVRDQVPQLFANSSYNIGCWHWELPELPDAWIASAGPLHEIWAPSSFIQGSISRKVTVPVVHMPHGIAVGEIEACSPQELGVPDGRFTFLCMFDFASVVQRKNPHGAMEAFRRAFPASSPATLLIKTSHADAFPADYAQLQEHLRGTENIILTDRMLSRGRLNGLLASCDAVVSLHRAEGFGLILAEAMFLGKPVVATGWSGNMDFMNSGNSCPVAHELVTLDRPYLDYEAGQQWAEPDLDDAARLMRRVVDEQGWRTQIGARARETIRTQFSPEAAGRRYRRRLAFLGLMEQEPISRT
jgi:glycosyltransferase involved in cell wall biosynthesis